MQSSRDRRLNINVEFENVGIWFYVKSSSQTNDEGLLAKDLFHSHPWMECQILLSGEMTYKTDDSKLSVKEGQVLLIPPTVQHALVSSNDILRLVIDFEIYQIGNSQGGYYQAISSLYTTKTATVMFSEEIKSITSNLSKYIGEPVLARNLRFRNELIRLFFECLDNIKKVHIKKDEDIKPDATDGSYARLGLLLSNPITGLKLKDLARHLYLTEKKVNEFVKARYGVTFKQLQIIERLNIVIRQISETDKSIEELAFDAGFNNLTHFYKVFKQYTGMTPYDYRKKGKAKPNSLGKLHAIHLRGKGNDRGC